MKLRYVNNQNKLDPMNGREIVRGEELEALLDDAQKNMPFVAELCGDNGFELVIGIAPDFGCVEHRRIDGDLPYLMAISTQPRMKSGYVEFLMTDTPTPIAARYIISFGELKKIALHFLKTGERSDLVAWQVFDPSAMREETSN